MILLLYFFVATCSWVYVYPPKIFENYGLLLTLHWYDFLHLNSLINIVSLFHRKYTLHNYLVLCHLLIGSFDGPLWGKGRRFKSNTRTGTVCTSNVFPPFGCAWAKRKKRNVGNGFFNSVLNRRWPRTEHTLYATSITTDVLPSRPGKTTDNCRVRLMFKSAHARRVVFRVQTHIHQLEFSVRQTYTHIYTHTHIHGRIILFTRSV